MYSMRDLNRRLAQFTKVKIEKVYKRHPYNIFSWNSNDKYRAIVNMETGKCYAWQTDSQNNRDYIYASDNFLKDTNYTSWYDYCKTTKELRKMKTLKRILNEIRICQL